MAYTLSWSPNERIRVDLEIQNSASEQKGPELDPGRGTSRKHPVSGRVQGEPPWEDPVKAVSSLLKVGCDLAVCSSHRSKLSAKGEEILLMLPS